MPDQLINKQGLAVAEEFIASFRAAFRGEVIRPGEPLYDDARRIWNVSVDKHPGIIVRCLDTGDVIDAVNFARTNDLLVSTTGVAGLTLGGR